MPNAIEVENLRFNYPDGTAALRGVSFSVEEGDCIGLIGPNGAGKTTLLLHLNGILKGEGAVNIYGRRIKEDNLALIRSDVGLVFQDPDAQLFMPTVFDDVAFGPMNMGLAKPEIERRVAEALESVDMEASAERISHHLSFGEKKRVSIATVLSMGPRILVLDEPSGNLDPKHRSCLIDILRSLPVTKIIASHDLDMLARLSNKIISMEDGRIVSQGDVRQMLGDREGHYA